MKKIVRKIAAIVCILAILASFATAYADDRYSGGYLNFVNGGYIRIPSDFLVVASDAYELDNNFYDFYWLRQDMDIMLHEMNSSSYARHPKASIDSLYEAVVEGCTNIVNKYKSKTSFALSGYYNFDGSAKSGIYYIEYVIDHGTLYTIEINYPTANRKKCDPVVDQVTKSFRSTGSKTGAGWQYSPRYGSGTPGPADLDSINADIKYPNYSFMYLDHYVTATVTHKAVYCFKDPDRDIWRNGNYFTVYRGTEVTILAESQGYACVILNDSNRAGWINMDYLSNT